MRIALLEDDNATGEILKTWLEADGHRVYRFSEGSKLIFTLQRDTFDLICLDWFLPDTTGDVILGWIREHLGWNVPVIFLTSRDAKADIANGLRIGADDYIPKPVSASELSARVSALARRFGHSAGEQILERPPFAFDLRSRTVTRSGEAIALTQKEFELAAFIFQHAGTLLSRSHILEAVWGRSSSVTTRTVDIHMSRLRKKLGLTESAGWRLSAVYHHGYRLEEVRTPVAATAA